MEKKIKVVILDENGEPIKTTIGDKLKEGAKKAAKKLEPVGRYVTEHPMETLAALASALAVGKTAKTLFGKTSAERERERIDHQYYDPRTGAHWQLTRQLSNRERAELMARQRSGEYTEDILEDLGVLK